MWLFRTLAIAGRTQSAVMLEQADVIANLVGWAKNVPKSVHRVHGGSNAISSVSA